jgi:tRNA(Ile)-lysidine synthase
VPGLLARCTFPPSGTEAVAAVSGGADSLALLALAAAAGLRVTAVHVDHGLRPGSAADAAYVRRLAARLGLPFEHVVAVGRPARGSSVEAWAREQRRTSALAVAREMGAARIATGHTLDDQAETVLMRVLSGAGAAGAAGIPPVLTPWVRPLLDVRRSETEAFCRALGLRPRQDPTNRDARYLRNAIRLRGLPALERATGRDVRQALARTGALLREDEEELSRLADEAFEDLARVRGSPVVVTVEIRASGLAASPPAIAGRVVLRAAYALGGTVTRADVEAVADLASGRPGRERSLSEGLRARRRGAYVHLARPSSEP